MSRSFDRVICKCRRDGERQSQQIENFNWPERDFFHTVKRRRIVTLQQLQLFFSMIAADTKIYFYFHRSAKSLPARSTLRQFNCFVCFALDVLIRLIPQSCFMFSFNFESNILKFNFGSELILEIIQTTNSFISTLNLKIYVSQFMKNSDG